MKQPHILVVGGGTMGSGIAQVSAQSGCPVTLYDVSYEAAGKARQHIEDSLVRAATKGYLDVGDVKNAVSRIHPVRELEEAADFDVAFEAVREDLAIKREVFRRLEEVARDDALLLSNTSMISITDIAAELRLPERAAGCHFFNPVPRMALVEVIAGAKTSEGTVEQLSTLMTSWGKIPIAAPDTPGFLVNRTLFMMLNEAAFLVEEGTPAANVDASLKLGCNHPMGPLELMDLIGIDVTYDIMVALWTQFDCAPKYKPCSLLQRMVQQGSLGRKSGEGFYKYRS
jgi:3-hydroxybutyryl-CoA dehydrogenase